MGESRGDKVRIWTDVHLHALCPTGRTWNNHGERSPWLTQQQRATCQNGPTITSLRATTCGVELPSPDNDDEAMMLPSAPVLKGAHNYRSPEMQELLQDRRWGLTRTRLTTHRLRVQVDHRYRYRYAQMYQQATCVDP
jgi:hypothetical protein